MISWSKVESSSKYKELNQEQARSLFQSWASKSIQEIRDLEQSGKAPQGSLDVLNARIDAKYKELGSKDIASVEFAKEAGRTTGVSLLGQVMGLGYDVIDIVNTPLAALGVTEKTDEMKIRERNLENFIEDSLRKAFKRDEQNELEKGVDDILEMVNSKEFRSLNKDEQNGMLNTFDGNIHKLASNLYNEDEIKYKDIDQYSLSSEENKSLLSAFRTTRDPRYLQAVKDNMTQSFDRRMDEKYVARLREDADKFIDILPDGAVKDVLKESKELALSPQEKITDSVINVLSAGIGKGLSSVVETGAKSKAVNIGASVVASSVQEVGAEGLLSVIQDPFQSDEDFYNTLKIAAASGAGMQGGVQTIGVVLPSKKASIETEPSSVSDKKSIIQERITKLESDTGQQFDIYDSLYEMTDGNVKTVAQKTHSEGNVEAFVDPESGNIVYNIEGIQKEADNRGITLEERVDQLNKHEVVVHNGIKKLYSDVGEFNDFHKGIWNSFEKEITKTISPNYKEFNPETEEGQIRLAHEYLAQFGESTNLDSSLWDTMVEKFNNFIKVVNPDYKGVTKAELRNVIRTSYTNMKDQFQETETTQEQTTEVQTQDQQVQEDVETEDASIDPIEPQPTEVTEPIDADIDVEGDAVSPKKLINSARESNIPSVQEAGKALENVGKRKAIEQTIQDADTEFAGYVSKSQGDINKAQDMAIRDLEDPNILSKYANNLDVLGSLGAKLATDIDNELNNSTDRVKVAALKSKQRRLLNAMSNLGRAQGRFINSLKLLKGNHAEIMVKGMISNIQEKSLKSQVDKKLVDDIVEQDLKDNNETLDEIAKEIKDLNFSKSIAITEKAIEKTVNQGETSIEFSKQEDPIKEGASKLLREFGTRKGGKTTNPTMKALLNSARKSLREERPAAKVAKMTDTEVLRTAFAEYDKYKQLLKEFESKIEKKFKNDPTKLQEFKSILTEVKRKELLSDKIFEGVLKEKLKDVQLKMDQIVRSIKENTSKEMKLKDALINAGISDLNLTGEQADLFATRFEQVFNTKIQEKRELSRKRIVDKFEKEQANQSSLPKKRRDALARSIALDNLNVFNYQDSYDAVAESLGLPSYSPDVASNIRGYMDRIQAAPDDSHIQKKVVHEMNQYIADEIGLDSAELLQGIYMSAMLSGWTTQGVNIFSGLVNLFGSNSAAVMAEVIKTKRPQDFIKFNQMAVLGAIEGLKSGIKKANLLMKTGYASEIQGIEKFIVPSTLDAAKFGKDIKFQQEDFASNSFRRLLNSPYGWLFNSNKYLMRAMNAVDLTIRDSARMSKSYVMAAGIARQKGLPFDKASEIANNILYRDVQSIEDAKIQAQTEGATGALIDVRAEEIIQEKIARDEAELIERSEEFAARASYNEPYRPTIMGAVAETLDTGFKTWIKQENPLVSASGRLTKLATFPFIRIIANVTDRVIDFSPAGMVRDRLRQGLEPDYKGTDKQAQQVAEAIAGTTAMIGAYTMIAVSKAMQDDGEDPIFTINGSGPKNLQDRYLWEQAGNTPWSIKIGRTSIPFKDNAFALTLGTLANVMEAIEDESTTPEAVGNVLMKTFSLWSDQSFLSGFENLSGIINSGDSIETKVKRVQRLFASAPAQTLIPATNFLMQTDKELDPTVAENKSLSEAILRTIPIVRRSNRPMLNAFGEPIQYPPSKRLIGNIRMKSDPFAKLLVDNGIGLSTPRRNTKLLKENKDGMFTNMDMSNDEFYDFHERSAKIYMPLLRDNVPIWVDSGLSPDLIQKYVRNIVNDSRDLVKSQMSAELMR